MNASILPEDEIDFAVDPEAQQVIEDARREAIADRSMDHNDSRFGGEFNCGTGFTGPQRERAEEARPASQERAPVDDPEIPAELRGKSAAEIAREYRKLHSQIGHNGAELGALRKSLAEAHQPQQSEAPAPTDATDDEAEFFVDPKKAIARAISAHPVVSSLKQAVTETHQRKATQQFLSEFPNAEQTLADPAFREWVSASKIRTELVTKAHEQYDLAAAREIFGTWKELRGGVGGAKPGGSKKYYRRADIQKLIQDDPARYEQLEPEIAKAYREGRVK